MKAFWDIVSYTVVRAIALITEAVGTSETSSSVLLWNPTVHHHVHMSSSLYRIRSTSSHSILSVTYFNVILPSTRTFDLWSPILIFNLF